MRTHGSALSLERRRRKAVALVEDDRLTAAQAAARVGASTRSVERWCKTFREQGAEALAAVPHAGRKAFLSDAQKEQLCVWLLEGARRHGFPNDLWTSGRIRQLIAQKFGVEYHREHMPKLLQRLQFSRQKPKRQSSERDEAAIEAWGARDWPRIKKKRGGKRRT